jgi:hypothetical protein
VLRRLHRVALAAAATVGVLACPGGRRGPPPERFVPANVAAAIVLPETARAVTELAALAATLSRFPGAGRIPATRGALAAQLGFDPLDPEALADAGLEPRRGAAVAWLRGRSGGLARAPLLLLPVDDAARLEALFVRLARDRLGATERSASRRGEASVVSLRVPGSAAPALSYAIVQRTAILCAGPSGVDAVAAAAAVPAEASLGEAAGWKAARRALGDEISAVSWTPPGSPLLEGLWPLADGLAVGLAAGPGRLVARAAVLLGAREPSFRALAADGEAAVAAARLDPRAHLVARWDGDFAALGAKLLPLVPSAERARLAAAGIDPARDLFGVLAPGGAVSLSLAPALDLADLSSRAVRADPLRAVEVEAVLPLKDSAAAEATSARVAALAARVRRATPPADGVFRIRTASGEIAWRVDGPGRRVVAAGGRPGRLAELEARLDAGAGWRPPTETSGEALRGGLGGAVLDPVRLVAAVRAMPEHAFGSGPSGFVMRSLVERVVEPASRLAAVSLRADLAEGALVLALEVEARAEEKR